MPLFVIPYPMISPVLLQIGPFALRWYALAYVAGLIAGWWLAKRIVANDRLWGGRARPTPTDIDDLIVYAALGVVLGGRIAYVLFYNFSFYLERPWEIFTVWRGGMSFHGGLIGCMLAMALLARSRRLPVLAFFDTVATVVPIGLFLGRLANFVNGELWGRVSDVPWAMVFPNGGPQPRHPSQLYEAGLEGVVLFIILLMAVRSGGLRRPGLICGLFGLGYGLARIAVEFVREPDAQLGYLYGGWLTMGMLLSLPLVLAGAALLWHAWRLRPAPLSGGSRAEAS
ncbi:MAG: prolipoprotein diacylglyceryl transferase [Hyphomicrobiales bacterium]|nr:prolipoprotein diacylglyceryl transferase [Hyphomicrobiales bacterium]